MSYKGYYVLKALIVLCTVSLICIALRFAAGTSYITFAADREEEKSPIVISCRYNEMAIDEALRISSHINSDEVNKNKLQWVSSNPECVSIESGVARGIAPGDTEIYLTDGSIKSNTLRLKCIIKTEKVVILNKTEDLYVGQSYQLDTQVYPEDAAYRTVTHTSLNPKIAAVNENGVIEALSPGTTQIAACDSTERNCDSFTLNVRIKKVESITIDDSQVELEKGEAYILEAKVYPEDASYRKVEWQSSNGKVAEVERGRVKALSRGTAEIRAITDNGDMFARCQINVVDSGVEKIIRYAGEELSVMEGAAEDSKQLCTIGKYASIQILKQMDGGICKVRTLSGVCGYVKCSSDMLLEEKPTPTPAAVPKQEEKGIAKEYYIHNAPYLNQFALGYPTGCEIVSAAMVLQYKGYAITADDLAGAIDKGSGKHQSSDGQWYGGNPFEEFVGDPSENLRYGSYGCFAKPLVNAIEKAAPDCSVKDISGCSEDELLAYVALGNPVIVWCVKNAGNLRPGVQWSFTDSSGSYSELVGEHCAVLIGYDGDYVYLNDPSAGQNAVQPRDKFFSNWKELYSQAIIVK